MRNVIASLILLTLFAAPALAQAEVAGDANGDGVVNGEDFDIWFQNSFVLGTDLSTGDFNGDGITDGQDFIIWNSNKSIEGKLPSIAGQVHSIPEPSTQLLMLFATWLLHRNFRLAR